ncbi:MAG: signal peptidase I [Acidobacteriota bacterium]
MKAKSKTSASKTPRTAIAISIGEWTTTFLIFVYATTLCAQPFVIPSGSMEDSLLVGDHVLVDKITYAPKGTWSQYLLPYRDPQQGDIVVFKHPLSPTGDPLVKRLIGVPGDRIRIEAKQVYRNSVKIDEPFKRTKSGYLDSYRDFWPPKGGSAEALQTAGTRLPDRLLKLLDENVHDGELVVPEGSLFVMGDNRDNSSDCRYWGLVPRENVIGTPVLIWWSFDGDGAGMSDRNLNLGHYVDVAANFFSKTRWDRTFRIVRRQAKS